MTEEIEPVGVVCGPADHEPLPGSIETACDLCGRAVWLSAASQKVLADYNFQSGKVGEVICTTCAVTHHGEERVELTERGKADILVAYGPQEGSRMIAALERMTLDQVAEMLRRLS